MSKVIPNVCYFTTMHLLNVAGFV